MSQVTNENSPKSKCNKKHLTLKDRQLILEGVIAGNTQKVIAESVGVSKTTVSRELLRHRKFVENHRPQNDVCAHIKNCEIKNLCQGIKCATKCKNCKYGKNCFDICSLYEKIKCERTNRFPYVCNGCEKLKYCQLDFWKYNPETANMEAANILVNSRRGINMSEEDFAKLDGILVYGTNKGQSVENIVTANNLNISPSTVRNYIAQGLTTVKAIDTPRGAVYKPRNAKVSKEQQAKSRQAKTGRDMAAFLNYANSVPFLFYTQLDTVEGCRNQQNKKRLMTLILVKVRLFYCVCLPDGTTQSIKNAFDDLYRKLGHDDFTFVFGTLLTDNGTEFSNPEDIETDSETGRKRARVFYCNPYSFWEKGAIEVSHELLRRIIPKGSDLSSMDDKKTKLINDNINSYIRPSDGEKTAYDTFTSAFEKRAEDILKKLEIDRIDPKNVELKPSLIEAGRN